MADGRWRWTGRPATASAELVDALAAALEGGPPVLPLPVLGPGRRPRGAPADHGRRHRHLGIDRRAQARGAVGRGAAGVGAGDRGAAGRAGAVAARAARRARRRGAGDRAGAARRAPRPRCWTCAPGFRPDGSPPRRPRWARRGGTPAWCRPSCARILAGTARVVAGPVAGMSPAAAAVAGMHAAAAGRRARRLRSYAAVLIGGAALDPDAGAGAARACGSSRPTA